MHNKVKQYFITFCKKVITIYALLIIIIFFFQSYLLFHPTRDIFQTPSNIDLPYENVWLTPNIKYPDNKIHGWFIPAQSNKGTILFLHGNAYNISYRLDTITLINELGYNCLIFDYRGYGKSTGNISENNMYEDAYAAWRYLRDKKKIVKNKIIIHGRSLGAGVASWLAKKVQPQALILESTFTSVPDIAQEKIFFVPAKLLCRYQYNTINRLDKMNCPIMFIHSIDDELIPFKHAKKLFSKYKGEKIFNQISGDHNYGFLISGQAYVKPLEKFYSSSIDSLSESTITGIVQ